MSRKRIDTLLVERGYFETCARAQAALLEGKVLVDHFRVVKPGMQVEEDSCIEVLSSSSPYVSRGGVKLQKALHEFQEKVSGKVCLDGGASTGGFTHCLLLHDARRVVAVDVGYGQLDWTLRMDPRVEVWERVNLRYPPEELVNKWRGQIDLLTLDMSFISVTKLLPAVRVFFHPSSILLTLIKPQFEAPREKVKKGVVKDPKVHMEVLLHILACSIQQGYFPRALTFSPLKGPKGNIEFFLRMACQGPSVAIAVDEVVRKAHEELSRPGVAL